MSLCKQRCGQCTFVIMAAGGRLKFTFPCGLRGFHEYHSMLTPTMGEELTAVHEDKNRFDRYAIAALKTLPGNIRPSTVGHLPREISRFTYYIIVHGGRVACKVTDVHHRRSPLVQGGLEIPVLVTITMELGSKNVQLMKKYEQLVKPVNGKFDDVTASLLKDLMSDDEPELESESETEMEVAV